jgi:hypothetical protein
MQIPFDADILIFAWTTAKIFFGSQVRAAGGQRAIPIEQEFEEVPDSALTPAQKNYVQPFDAQLAALHYRLDCSYRVRNTRSHGNNLVRRYCGATDAASCALTIVELKVRVGKTESVKTSSHLSFTTRFAGDQLLVTRNMALPSLLAQPPWRTVQEYRTAPNVGKLKAVHDQRAAQMGTPVAPPSGAEEILREQRAEYQRFSEFQLQHGTYQMTADGRAYQTTDKVRRRGIWNHYNLFSGKINWTEMTLSALIGCVFPLLAILWAAPHAERMFWGSRANSASPLSMILIAAFYALGGLLIGAVAERAPFHWIMFVSYVPAHLLAGWSFGWLPYSTCMFLVATKVRQAIRRRKLIFEPQ